MGARPYSSSALVYDLLYRAAGKDYAGEAEQLHRLVQERRPGARSLLDVACGTAAHLQHLQRFYRVEGVDIEPTMLDQARRRLPDVTLTQGDMRTFRLPRTFDVVVCLFSSIGYMPSTADLDSAMRAMAGHLNPGGLLVIDGWVRPESWRDPGSVHALSASTGDLAAARVGISRRDGHRTVLEMHHLVGSRDGVDHVVESHHLTLFRDEEYRRAVEGAGLTVEVVASPMPDRDRYIGTDPR